MLVVGCLSMDLEPGYYWGEICFDRPAEGETVLSALRAAGFSEVYLEHKDPPPGYAGRMRAAGMFAESVKAANLSTNAIKASAANTFTAQTKAVEAPPPAAPLKTQASVSTQAPIKAPDPITQQASASTQVSIRATETTAQTGSPTSPARGIVDTTPRPPREQAPATPPPAPAQAYDPYQFGVDDSQGQGGYASPDQGYGGSAYEGASEDAAPETPGYDYGEYSPPGYTRAASAMPAPAPSPRPAAPGGGSIVATAMPAPPPGCFPIGPGMFLCPPASGAKVGARSVWRFPFVARLDRPVTLKDAPYARWTRAVRLPFDPFAPMTFQIVPWTLDEGVVYGLRFLSRDRSVRNKNDVARILVGMGFDPVSLLLAHRNMRVPRRGASCSEWVGFGRWTGPATVVTKDDPFYFAEARPYVDIVEG